MEKMLKGHIVVDGLRLFARHGVMPQERVVGNTFEVSLKLDYQCAGAVLSDSLDDAVDYSVVVALVKEQMGEPSALIEHVAGRIRAAVCARFPSVTGGSIAIYKLQPPIPAELARVGFVLEW